MIKTILAPLDGTQTAEAGLTWAEHAAARCGAGIRLLTVVDEAAGAGNGRAGEAESYLREHCERLQAKGLAVEFEVAVGNPTEYILAQAESADLTVMTSGATRWLVGAVLDNVLREMRRPVIIARGVPGQTPPPPNFSKILVPLDRAPYSLHILPTARNMAQALRASIVLCHTVAPMGQHHDGTDAPPGVARIIEEELDQARRFLAPAAETIEAEGVTVEVITTMGNASREIIRVADRSQAGLIAMASRGRDRLEARIVGSVANIVVESTNLPCLLARPDDVELPAA
jgi:nucleotide-binding universal stress UspA family protein